MIAYLLQQSKLTAAEQRAQDAAEFKRSMELFVREREERLITIRKHHYWRVKNEVKRGLRSSIDLLEFELWKGF